MFHLQALSWTTIMSAQRKRKASLKYLSGKDFRSWRVSRDLTLSELSDWLGLTPGAVYKYEQRGATKSTALALSALDRGLTPWTPDSEEKPKENSDEEHSASGDRRKS